MNILPVFFNLDEFVREFIKLRIDEIFNATKKAMPGKDYSQTLRKMRSVII